MTAARRARSPVRNRSGWRQRLARLGGSPVDLDLRGFDAPLEAVREIEEDLGELSDAAIAGRARDLGARARAGAELDGLRNETFALACEAAARTLGMRPFDVQVAAALSLARGRIVEMQTGEGKTLAAVLPAVLYALGGRGVHVLTFNDYLACRDAEWMGPVYRMLGLSVAAVQQGMPPEARRRGYRADVTYVTAKEAGFDHLRDLRATDPGAVVHRPFHVALVDEADSLLVDEARAPLVLAACAEPGDSPARRIAALVGRLTPGADFDTDEYGRSVELTDAGVARMERSLDVVNLHDGEHYPLLTAVNCALHARVLLRRDVDYLVRDGRIGMIDELTGRVVPDRHWPDGLQAALEAKEGLEPDAGGQVLGSMPLQHFLRGYPFLCGMTGTARDAAAELRENLRARGDGRADQPAADPDRPSGCRLHASRGEGARRRRRGPARARPPAPGPRRHPDGRRVRAPSRSGCARPASPARSSTRRTTRRKRASWRAPGDWARSPSPPTWPAAAPTSVSAAATRRSTRRWRRSGGCTSSAPTGTRAGASTCSSGAAPAGRATRESPASS